jgi:hypothetical protein
LEIGLLVVALEQPNKPKAIQLAEAKYLERIIISKRRGREREPSAPRNQRAKHRILQLMEPVKPISHRERSRSGVRMLQITTLHLQKLRA